MSKLIQGVYVAVTTPRTARGAVDEQAFSKWIGFLHERGIRGFAVNGATGEYCQVTPKELERLLTVFRNSAAGRADLLCGVGSPAADRSVELGRVAKDHGAGKILVPGPSFFRYEQEDVASFCRQVVETLELPALLYNLPQFTAGYEPSTVLQLMESCPLIQGIKDSSGSLEILRVLTAQRPAACRIMGNDGVLAAALEERICDGVISGVAAAVPELILSMFAAGAEPNSPRFAEVRARLDEFLAQIRDIPVPWALKWVAEARGVAPASLPFMPSERRRLQGDALQSWFSGWAPQAVHPV